MKHYMGVGLLPGLDLFESFLSQEVNFFAA